jgi:hypothetical protein
MTTQGQLPIDDVPYIAPDTQRDRIMIELHAWPDGVCGTQFLKMHIPRYSARILELRQGTKDRPPVKIDKERCHQHYHPTAQFLYRLG